MGLELTATSVTSVVTDLTGWVLAKAGAPVAVSRPRPGWVEANPHDWLAAAIVTIRRAVHDAGVWPHAVGVSGQSHGLVLVDADGVPVRPAILLSDARAVLGATAYRDLPDGLRARLANPPDPAAMGPVLSWLIAHEPDAYARTRRVLQPKDWLRAQLTGDLQTEPSDASTTLLYDVLAQRWSVEAAARMGLDPGLLPEILPGAGHQAGLVTRSAANMIGVPAGTPVAAGATRNAAAVLGAGLSDGTTAQIVLGAGAHVVAAVPALPHALPLTGDLRVLRAATDRGWCVLAPVAAASPSSCRRRFTHDIAAAVRRVTAIAPVTRLQVSGVDALHRGLLESLAELVDEPLHTADPVLLAARAAALLGARAASLLDEETVVAQFAPAAFAPRWPA